MLVPPSRTIGWGTEHELGGGPGLPPNRPYWSELPHYEVVRAYPDLQSLEAPAEPSSLAPSSGNLDHTDMYGYVGYLWISMDILDIYGPPEEHIRLVVLD